MKNPRYAAVPPNPPHESQAFAAQRSARFSVLSIEEVIAGASIRGRRLQMLRVDQPGLGAAAPPGFEMPALNSMPGRLSMRQPAHRPEVVLREVGEVVADRSGRCYESEGARLRPLGELFMNEQGQIFEVCREGQARPAGGELRQGHCQEGPSPAQHASVGRQGRPAAKGFRRPSFRYSRRQVLAKMGSLLGTLPTGGPVVWRWLVVYPLRAAKLLLVMLISPLRLRRWKKRLSGKSRMEQLWRVPPPNGFSYHPLVRRWAEEMFDQAGYKQPGIFLEWEIHWRRQGVR